MTPLTHAIKLVLWNLHYHDRTSPAGSSLKMPHYLLYRSFTTAELLSEATRCIRVLQGTSTRDIQNGTFRFGVIGFLELWGLICADRSILPQHKKKADWIKIFGAILSLCLFFTEDQLNFDCNVLYPLYLSFPQICSELEPIMKFLADTQGQSQDEWNRLQYQSSEEICRVWEDYMGKAETFQHHDVRIVIRKSILSARQVSERPSHLMTDLDAA